MRTVYPKRRFLSRKKREKTHKSPGTGNFTREKAHKSRRESDKRVTFHWYPVTISVIFQNCYKCKKTASERRDFPVFGRNKPLWVKAYHAVIEEHIAVLDDVIAVVVPEEPTVERALLRDFL